MTDNTKTVHEGHNIKRIREILGIKQETLATELGEDWNQKKVSQLEQREAIDPDTLESVAKALKVPVDAIKNFNDDATIFNIQHNYEGANEGVTSVAVQNYYCTFNPLDKVVELYERIIKEQKELLDKYLPDGKK